MELLKILALTLTMADGAYSCKQINSNRGFESNRFMPKTCKGILIQKSILTIPMFVIPNKKIQKAFVISNMTGGGIGLTVSVINMNKD